MRSFLLAVAVSLPMQFAQSDTLISRSSGTLYDPFGMYGSGTGPYTMEVRAEFAPDRMLDTNNASLVYFPNAVFDFTVLHNNVSTTFSAPGSLQLRVLDWQGNRLFEQVMFYQNHMTEQTFIVDPAVFPGLRPLQPAAAGVTSNGEHIGHIWDTKFRMFGNEVTGIEAEAWTTSMDAYSFQVITSIPEPRSYVMLVAGLELLMVCGSLIPSMRWRWRHSV